VLSKLSPINPKPLPKIRDTRTLKKNKKTWGE
jgi:hypothetical protein